MGKKVGKKWEKCWKNPKKEKNEKKTVRNSAFHQYDQMSLDSPLTWTLIAVQKKRERGRERGRERERGPRPPPARG